MPLFKAKQAMFDYYFLIKDKLMIKKIKIYPLQGQVGWSLPNIYICTFTVRIVYCHLFFIYLALYMYLAMHVGISLN